MAMLAVCGSTGIRPPLCCVEGGFASTRFRARGLPLQRARLGEHRWRVACAGVDYASEWRRECGELRLQIHELQGALADEWMQDEISLMQLEKLVSSLLRMYARAPDQASEARDSERAVMNSAVVRKENEPRNQLDLVSKEDEVEVIGKPEPEGVDELYKNEMIVSELRSEEIRSKQEGLSTLRRLNKLNVHEYVHNSLRESYLRSWLKSRGIAE
ncbi:hypothetical protein KC19_2G179800 [Ceratodon purpureus]|uniref:Uncharacterized protein n=1 Tax=Ceratodon purpureus TaxID=3225 RepID=A0A8T0IX13_CERPU|nr:hypothetical protein KC19_2G179800 [Ceratodon purpureus]